jgi:hypothetical protein
MFLTEATEAKHCRRLVFKWLSPPSASLRATVFKWFHIPAHFHSHMKIFLKFILRQVLLCTACGAVGSTVQGFLNFTHARLKIIDLSLRITGSF